MLYAAQAGACTAAWLQCSARGKSFGELALIRRGQGNGHVMGDRAPLRRMSMLRRVHVWRD